MLSREALTPWVGIVIIQPWGGRSLTFLDKLSAISRRNRSLLCIGLDPDPALMPPVSVFEFNRAIIEATSDLVCAYKPNLAFYEALGVEGLEALKKTVEFIPDDVVVIGDGKRSDIGHSAGAYAKALFSYFGFDATTVNPYLGHDSVAPFLEYRDRGVFILCRTSNTGATDFQDLSSPQGEALFHLVARKAGQWNQYGNGGLVVGATYPEELRQIRQLCPQMPLLIPGVGAQGGDLELAVRYGVDSRGERAIINSSRQVIYASKGQDFAQAARRAALRLRDEINRYREPVE
jgi:orotidine-5'-phosphate decarboxylase